MIPSSPQPVSTIPWAPTTKKAFGHDTGLHNFTKNAFTFFQPSSKILDVGCGTGTSDSSAIAFHGHKVTGIDIAPSMVELSRKAVPGAEFEVATC